MPEIRVCTWASAWPQFDGMLEIAFKSVETETWRRFRLTDAAQQLAQERPHLLLEDDSRSEQMARLGGHAMTWLVQNQVQKQLHALCECMRRAHCHALFYAICVGPPLAAPVLIARYSVCCHPLELTSLAAHATLVIPFHVCW